MCFRKKFAAVAILALYICGDAVFAQEAWRKEVEAHREKRNAFLKSDPFSPLGLVHREYLDGRTRLTIGSGAEMDLRLEKDGVEAHHATLEVSGATITVRAEGDAYLGLPARPTGGGEVRASSSRRREVDLMKERAFRIFFYNLLYRAEAPVRGAALEIYDVFEPALGSFTGLEYFAPDAKYHVEAEVWPSSVPGKVQLVDSAGQPRPYFVWGELRFELDGKTVAMELYTTTLDGGAIERDGFMLIFADLTSGRESYYAGRYLDIPGKMMGKVTVDFNLARNPPCAFSPVYTCPFPRAQNRLPVAIRAGEKAFRGVTATVRQSTPAR
jgi:uncharacterized protein (DUF1684 family)